MSWKYHSTSELILSRRFSRCSKSACPERAKELKGFGSGAASAICERRARRRPRPTPSPLFADLLLKSRARFLQKGDLRIIWGAGLNSLVTELLTIGDVRWFLWETIKKRISNLVLILNCRWRCQKSIIYTVKWDFQESKIVGFW